MIILEFVIFYIAIKYWAIGDLTAGDFIWIQAGFPRQGPSTMVANGVYYFNYLK